jgi:hypothetical protein
LTIPKATGEPDAGFAVPSASEDVPPPDVVEPALLELLELLFELPHAATPTMAAHASTAAPNLESREELITSPIPS